MNLKYFILVLAAPCVQSIFIKLYDKRDFEGFFHEESIPELHNTCTDIPDFGRRQASSVKKSPGSCIILYQRTNCSGLSYRLYSKGDYHRLDDFDKLASSFRPCNEGEGGSKVMLNFYSGSIPNGHLVPYDNVCGCTSLPDYAVSAGVVSLDNHGNCVKLFEGPRCTGEFRRIRAGKSAASENLEKVNFERKTRSVSPCEGHPPCVQLNAQITKVVISEEPARKELKLTQPMKSTSFYRNDGSGMLTQQYTASLVVQESVEVTRLNSLRTTHSSETSVTVTAEAKDMFSFSKVSTAVTQTYSYSKEVGSSEGNNFKKETAQTFSVSQTIEVPPCTEYEVRSYVEITDNQSLKFVTFMNVTGETSGREMSADELQEHVGELHFVSRINDTAVLAKEEGFIKVRYGESKFIAKAKKIEGCERYKK